MSDDSVGIAMAQFGALNVLSNYRNGTLGPGMCRVVDMTLEQCSQRESR